MTKYDPNTPVGLLGLPRDEAKKERQRRSAAARAAHVPTRRPDDAARWGEVARRFYEAKTSASERVLEGLGFDAADVRPLADIVDEALELRAPGAKA